MPDELSMTEERLSRLESTVARLCADPGTEVGAGISIPLPVRFVTAEGTVAIELSSDVDGGLICIKDLQGRVQITLGSGLAGGWLDIHHKGGNTLAVSLAANDDGGAIEYSVQGQCHRVAGERYWPGVEVKDEVD